MVLTDMVAGVTRQNVWAAGRGRGVLRGNFREAVALGGEVSLRLYKGSAVLGFDSEPAWRCHLDTFQIHSFVDFGLLVHDDIGARGEPWCTKFKDLLIWWFCRKALDQMYSERRLLLKLTILALWWRGCPTYWLIEEHCLNSVVDDHGR